MFREDVKNGIAGAASLWMLLNFPVSWSKHWDPPFLAFITQQG